MALARARAYVLEGAHFEPLLYKTLLQRVGKEDRRPAWQDPGQAFSPLPRLYRAWERGRHAYRKDISEEEKAFRRK